MVAVGAPVKDLHPNRPLKVAIAERPHTDANWRPHRVGRRPGDIRLGHHRPGLAVLVATRKDQKGVRSKKARPPLSGEIFGAKLQLGHQFAAGQLLGDDDNLAAVPVHIGISGQPLDVLPPPEADHDLRHGGLVGPQEVLPPVWVLVPDLEAEPLDGLKVVVDDELADPGRAEAVPDGLGSAHFVEALLPTVAHQEDAVGIGFGEDVHVDQIPTAEGHLDLGGAHFALKILMLLVVVMMVMIMMRMMIWLLMILWVFFR